jgi:Family of unknown function (DUF6941)
MSPVVPKCLALILCDAVRRVRPGGDPTIVRAFDAFDVPAFPAKTGRFSVWIQLTDGNGVSAMRLIIEHIPPDSVEAELVVPIEFSVDFANPNVVVDHEAVLHDGIELEKVGRYRLRVEADGVTILQRYFVARHVS